MKDYFAEAGIDLKVAIKMRRDLEMVLLTVTLTVTLTTLICPCVYRSVAKQRNVDCSDKQASICFFVLQYCRGLWRSRCASAPLCCTVTAGDSGPGNGSWSTHGSYLCPAGLAGSGAGLHWAVTCCRPKKSLGISGQCLRHSPLLCGNDPLNTATQHCPKASCLTSPPFMLCWCSPCQCCPSTQRSQP